MHKILIVEPLHPTAMNLLDERSDVSYEVIETPTERLLTRRIVDVDALTIRVSPLPPAVLAAATRLKVVSRHGVGYDNVPVDVCNQLGIPVTIVGATNAISVAEHTIYLMLAVAKQAVAGMDCVRSGCFAGRGGLRGMELFGKTILIAGYGRIGRQVAIRAKALGMKIVVYDPYALPDATEGMNVVDSFEEGLRVANVVTLHLPLTEQTRNMLGSDELELLPKDSIVVNASRGGVLCETALLDAIDSGSVFGAGLDVFAQEPVPAGSPLLNSSRIVLSPHSAALTEESLVAMGRATVQNALDAIDGQLDVENVVNPEVLG